VLHAVGSLIYPTGCSPTDRNIQLSPLTDADRAALAKILWRAGAPPDRLDQFAADVAASITAMEVAGPAPVMEVRKELTELRRIADAILEGHDQIKRSRAIGFVRAIDLLHETIEFLPWGAREELNERARRRRTPTLQQVAATANPKDLAKAVVRLVTDGGAIVAGRRRGDDGRRSAPRYQPVIGPQPRSQQHRRPIDERRMQLIGCLALDYQDATGRSPSRWRRNNQRGPFADLVAFAFERLGLSAADYSLRQFLAQLPA
jgi:hypothetical protein